MESKVQLTGIKKRQQIQAANKAVFLWITLASIVVSFCLVAGQFLVRKAMFNQKVISATSQTRSTLEHNINEAAELKSNINALLGNSDLASVKTDQSDSNLKIVLDALPTLDDRPALAASLQQVVLPRSGVSVKDLVLESESPEVESSAESAAAPASPSGVSATQFNFQVTGTYDQVKTMLQDMRRSIRPLNVKSLVIENQEGAALQVTVSGETYYRAAQQVELKQKTVKP